MLRRLLPSRRATERPVAVPDGRRIYAIGDIHGRLDLLDSALTRLHADDRARGAAETTIVFLGDLVDRGPESAGVIDRLCELSASGCAVRFLMGNHEEVFLLAIGGDRQAARLFCRIGGRETLMSYGVGGDAYERMSYDEVIERLQALVPPSHVAFLTAFEALIVVGDYAFVHAGVRPGVPLDQQRGEDLRWIREPFLDHRGTLEKVIVHGHTIREEVEFRPHRIGIDTGGYATGRLTVLGLEGTERWVLAS